MTKLLQLLGLDEIQYTFSDFERSLRKRYIQNFIFDFLLIVVCGIFTFTTKYYKASAAFLAIIVILLLFHIYGVLQLLSGKVYCIEGILISDEKKAFREKVLATTITILGTSKIKIKSNGIYYTIPVNHASKFEEGSTVRVYFVLNNAMQETEKQYKIISPIFVTTVIDEESV